jgi:hypothetical protein
MTNEMFGKVVNYLIGVLLMIAALYMVRANPKLKEKKIFGFPFQQVLYAVCCFFVLMIILSLLIPAPKIIYKEK